MFNKNLKPLLQKPHSNCSYEELLHLIDNLQGAVIMMDSRMEAMSLTSRQYDELYRAKRGGFVSKIKVWWSGFKTK